MDIKDLLKDAHNLTNYEFKNRLERLVSENYRYRNLDTKNRKLVFDIIRKYHSYLRKGYGISPTMIRNENYRLYKNRNKLDLSLEDLEDIKEILNEFKK